jgi:hypothetical protein
MFPRDLGSPKEKESASIGGLVTPVLHPQFALVRPQAGKTYSRRHKDSIRIGGVSINPT